MGILFFSDPPILPPPPTAKEEGTFSSTTQIKGREGRGDSSTNPGLVYLLGDKRFRGLKSVRSLGIRKLLKSPSLPPPNQVV